jgi:hypothetical protein
MKTSYWLVIDMIVFGVLGNFLGWDESTIIISIAVLLSASQICRAIEGKK